MSGLGIVLEEAESPRPRSHSASPTLAPPFDESDNLNLTKEDLDDSETDAFAEPLLPPLPKGEPFLRSISTSFASLNESPSSSHAHSNSGSTVGDDSASALNDFLSGKSYASYELDSPSLNIENMPLQFPDPHPSPSAGQNGGNGANTANGTSTSPSSNSSPLRRLKSLKMGIRKLSLSKITSPAFSSSSTTSTPVHEPSAQLSANFEDFPTSTSYRPVTSPLQSQMPQLASSGHDTSSSASSSLRSSTFSASNGQYGENSTTPSTQTASAPNLTLNLGSGRRRTLSNPMLASAASTPPIPSPVITLSENLSHSKKTLSETEQSFFDTLQTSATASEVNSTHSGSKDQPREKIDSIDKLSTSDELIEYSIFLHEHKKSIEDAFDVTKDRLSHSGWCSSNDLENLALQRDSSLSQIDTKLAKVEEQLNSRFNLSVLHNAAPAPVATKKSVPKTPSISPSLKVLESRCLSFALEMSEA